MQAKDIDAARPYILMDHFKMEVMSRRSRSAGQLVEFVTSSVRFYELVTSVEPKRKALALLTDELKAATQVGYTFDPSIDPEIPVLQGSRPCKHFHDRPSTLNRKHFHGGPQTLKHSHSLAAMALARSVSESSLSPGRPGCEPLQESLGMEKPSTFP